MNKSSVTCEINQYGKQKLAQKSPYLTRKDFLESLPPEGTDFEITHNGKHLAFAYTGFSQKSDVGIVDEPLSSDFFQKKVQQAFAKRKKLFKELPEAYRLIHSEADGIPGIHVEIFADFAVITYFNHGIEKYKNELIDALKSTLSQVKGVYAKDRTPTPRKPETELLYGESAPNDLIVHEGTGEFIVRLNSGLMTGLFLDQRANRKWLRSNSQNKTICNTFSYTAGLSIACAVGGAKETTSVDISKTYSDWAKTNFALNNLSLERNRIVTSDTFDHFQFCQRKGIRYDMIILDPPTFSKKKSGTFSVQKNYQELVRQSISLLNASGVLVCSTNYSQWDEKAFLEVIDNVFRSLKRGYSVVYKAHADKDFPILGSYPESNHLKFIALQITN